MHFLVVVRFASCSEDSLPLSYMHQFYSGYQLLPPCSTCVGDTSSRAFAPELLRSFHVHHVFMGFFHFDGDHFRAFLFMDPTLCMQTQTQVFAMLHLEFEGGC